MIRSEKFNSIDKIILGHNPLFGVDHLNQARGNEKQVRFENSNELKSILHYAYSKGIKSMMMSTHPRSQVILNIIKNDSVLKENFTIYPLLPYIIKYVRKANEKGMLNLIIEILSQSSFKQKLNLVFSGTKGILNKNVDDLIRILIDIEMLPFKGIKLGPIFLHDALTDLAIGLGVESVLDTFRNHIENNYQVPAGLITKNIPLIREKLEDRGWRDYLLMAAFNKTGFLVNPSLKEVEKEIQRGGIYFIPMSSLAAGALKPEEAYEYISKFNKIKSVVVGASQKKHIDELVEVINQYIV